MARNEFETEVGKLLNEKYPFVHRIADAAFNRNMGRQVSKKPFDYVATTLSGIMVAAEVKRVKVNRFSFSALSDHQRDALKSIWNSGGIAVLFINFRVKSPGIRCGRAFCIPYGTFEAIEDACILSGRKSMAPDHIPSIWEMDRVVGGWSLKEDRQDDNLEIINTARMTEQEFRNEYELQFTRTNPPEETNFKYGENK